MSVDLEDWFAITARRFLGVTMPPSSRVVSATRIVLDVLDRAATRATFFVLGTVAETYPELVREVAARGHEIGTHGHGHRRLHDIGRAAFVEDLARSLDAIERACGVRARGHRAPEFSVTARAPWAFDVLAEAGLTYDSSVFPIRHRRYGIPGAPIVPYRVEAHGRQITEFPLATFSLGTTRIPAAGGGYLRLFPFRIIDGAVRQAESAGRPAILYVHPYEFDPEPLTLDLPTTALRRRFALAVSNAGRHRSPARLLRLLQRYRFGPLGDLVR